MHTASMLTPLSNSAAASTLNRKRPLESDPEDPEDLISSPKIRQITGVNSNMENFSALTFNKKNLDLRQTAHTSSLNWTFFSYFSLLCNITVVHYILYKVLEYIKAGITCLLLQNHSIPNAHMGFWWKFLTLNFYQNPLCETWMSQILSHRRQRD